jgi:hypothetical protein
MKNLFPRVVKGRPSDVLTLVTVAFAAAVAFDAHAAAEVQVVAKEKQYVFGAAAYESLNLLEDAVRAARPSVVELDACGPGASRSLQAAAHRLNDLALRIRVLDESAPRCRTGTVAMPVGKRSSPGIGDVDDSAVAQYWQQVTP